MMYRQYTKGLQNPSIFGRLKGKCCDCENNHNGINDDHCCHFVDSCCIKLVLLFSGTLHRFEEMEEKRHDRELKFRLEMRREEREHELRVLQMMMQTRGCNSQWTTS